MRAIAELRPDATPDCILDGTAPDPFPMFAEVVRSRRSVRAFTAEPIPDAVLDACLDLALLAPTSHNLESWQFFDVREPATLQRLRHLCLDQPAAVQAPSLIVAVARPDFWRIGAQQMLQRLAADAKSGGLEEPYRSMLPLLQAKYRYQVPLLFEDGPMRILAPLKTVLMAAIGQFRPMMRGPFGRAEQAMWAMKTTALACQNLMLALRAAGYDSCPLEGFDEPQVKRLLGLPSAARVAMVIAAGRGAPGGVIPQFRLERTLHVRRV